MANGSPLSRIVSGAQQISNFQEDQRLSPLRRQSAELGVRGQQIGLEQQEAKSRRFIDTIRNTDTAEAAAQFLATPPEQRRAFLENRVQQIRARGGDPVDTMNMLNFSPQEQEEQAKAAVQIGEQLGVLKPQADPARSPIRVGTIDGKPAFVRDDPTTGRLERVEGALPPAKGPLTQVTVEGDTPAKTPTAFEKEVDKRAAETVLDWTTGGRSKALQNVSEFSRIRDDLESGKINTRTVGDFMPFVSDDVRRIFNEPAAEAVNDIRAIAFQVLRETLGAQFTEKEGERLMATYFDPKLSEQANLRRMDRMVKMTEQMVEDKDRLAKFMDKNRTAIGFQSIAPDPMQTLRELVDEADSETDKKDIVPSGVDPGDWDFMTDEQKKLWQQ